LVLIGHSTAAFDATVNNLLKSSTENQGFLTLYKYNNSMMIRIAEHDGKRGSQRDKHGATCKQESVE